MFNDVNHISLCQESVSEFMVLGVEGGPLLRYLTKKKIVKGFFLSVINRIRIIRIRISKGLLSSELKLKDRKAGDSYTMFFLQIYINQILKR